MARGMALGDRLSRGSNPSPAVDLCCDPGSHNPLLLPAQDPGDSPDIA